MLRQDPYRRLMALKPPADVNALPAWWQRVCAEMAMVSGYAYNTQTGVMTVPDDTDLEGRPSEPLGTVLQYIGANGTGVDTRLLPISKVGNFGVVIEPSPITAADVGANVTVTIAAFVPQFDFGTLNVSGATITGLSFSTFYYIYLTGFNYANGAYTAALATTSAKTMQADGNFYIGSITTPADGGAGTGGSGGGGALVPGSDIEP